MCTLTFLKDVIRGTKRLLKLTETAVIPQIPRLAEIDIKLLWYTIRKDKKMAEFFPEIYVRGKSAPNREYFFTVF